MEWVAISYSRGSSQPKDQTWVSKVSCISRGITAKVGDGQWSLGAAVHGVAKNWTRLSDWTELRATWKAPKHARFHEFACHLHEWNKFRVKILRNLKTHLEAPRSLGASLPTSGLLERSTNQPEFGLLLGGAGRRPEQEAIEPQSSSIPRATVKCAAERERLLSKELANKLLESFWLFPWVLGGVSGDCAPVMGNNCGPWAGEQLIPWGCGEALPDGGDVWTLSGGGQEMSILGPRRGLMLWFLL